MRTCGGSLAGLSGGGALAASAGTLGPARRAAEWWREGAQRGRAGAERRKCGLRGSAWGCNVVPARARRLGDRGRAAAAGASGARAAAPPGAEAAAARRAAAAAAQAPGVLVSPSRPPPTNARNGVGARGRAAGPARGWRPASGQVGPSPASRVRVLIPGCGTLDSQPLEEEAGGSIPRLVPGARGGGGRALLRRKRRFYSSCGDVGVRQDLNTGEVRLRPWVLSHFSVQGARSELGKIPILFI